MTPADHSTEHSTEHSSDPAAEYDALHSGVGLYRLPREVVSLAGPDADAYLQGQCSQDLAELAVGAAADSFLLAPEGRLDALVRVVRTGTESFTVDVEGGFGEAVRERLRRFRLRSKVEIELLDWICVSVRGAATPQALAGLDTEARGVGPLVVPVAWGAWRGVDLLGPATSVEAAAGVLAAAGGRWCTEEIWEAARIHAGVPRMGRDLDERTIPAETGLLERAVSFTKGCYTGQELVARMEARGNRAPRRLAGVVVDAGSELAASAVRGAALRVSGEEKAVGTVTSAAWSPALGAVVGLGMVRRGIEVPATVTLEPATDTGAVPAEVRELPLVA